MARHDMFMGCGSKGKGIVRKNVGSTVVMFPCGCCTQKLQLCFADHSYLGAKSCKECSPVVLSYLKTDILSQIYQGS